MPPAPSAPPAGYQPGQHQPSARPSGNEAGRTVHAPLSPANGFPATTAESASEAPREPEVAGRPRGSGFGGNSERAEADAGQADAYSADDPAYGPPDPSWFALRRQEEQEQAEEDARRESAAEELRNARGPFEPPSQQFIFREREPLPGEAGFGTSLNGNGGAGSEQDALGRLKDMYMTAEAVGDDKLQQHYEELLERQRQLIGEYFREPGSVPQPGAGGPTVTAGRPG
jgi:hypothetical protein